MLSQLENFYDQKQEPVKSCLLSLRKIILDFDKEIHETWKYQIPFFLYKKKMFCYLYQQKKGGHPYIGFAKGQLLNHPLLIQGNRKKMKVLPIEADKDIPIHLILEILKEARFFY